MALHNLLYGSANVAQPYVDAGVADACVGGLLDGEEEVVVLVVEVDCEGAVDDVAVDLRAEVDLADVAVLEDGGVAVVRRWRRRCSLR